MTDTTALQASNEKTIRECDAAARRAVMSAMKTTGRKRHVHLWFAALFDRIGDEMREVEAQRKRGNDAYHDEY